MSRTRTLSIFFLAGLTLGVASARGDEVLPAATATEDLESFDRSVVIPDARSASGPTISAEARRLQEERRRDADSHAGLTGRGRGKQPSNPSESGRGSSVRNSNADKRPAPATTQRPSQGNGNGNGNGNGGHGS